jgi:tetratricopeptide (TPR) repeat protein
MGELMNSAGDSPNGAIVAAIGTDRAIDELKTVKPGDISALPLIYAIQRVEAQLWECSGSAMQRGKTLEKMTSILMRFNRERPWDQRPEWAQIGHGEALYMQHRYDEALSEANRLEIAAQSDQHFTSQQKAGIAWLQGIVLYEMKDFRQAIPHLEFTATHNEFSHSREAWPLWVAALAKTGENDRANQLFDEWIRQEKPSVDTAQHILEIVQASTSN